MECNICYESSPTISCFKQCHVQVCRPCFKRMIEITENEVCYTCPVCRHENIYGRTRAFTRFIDRSNDMLRHCLGLRQQDMVEMMWMFYQN